MTVLPSGEKEQNTPADWGEVYTILLAHTSLSYDEIGKRTIPQVEAVMANLGRHVGLKVGVPVGEGGGVEPKEEHTVDDAMAFVAAFTGA